MKWNLIRLELFQNRRGFLIWTIVILLFQLIFTSTADTFIEDPELIKLKYEALPPAVLEGLGINLDLMTSYEGWMAGQSYTYYVLMLGMFACIAACTSIARERDQETREFLFALPFSRSEIFFSKACAHGIQITVIATLNLLIIWAGGAFFSQVTNPDVLCLLALTAYLVALAFAGIGYAVTVFLTSERAAMSLGIGIVMLMFVFNMLAAIGDAFAWLTHLSLFHAFTASGMVSGSGLTWSGVLITLGIYALGLLFARSVLVRQDL